MIESLEAVLTADALLAGLIAAASGVLHGYTGFGAALLLVPLLSLMYGPVEAIVVSSMVATIGVAQLIPPALRRAGGRELLPVVAAILLTTPLGVALLFTVDPGITRRAIGGFVLLMALGLLTGWNYHGRQGPRSGFFAGSLTGTITGFAGVGGLPVALYFLATPQPPELQRANIVLSVGSVIVVVLVSVAIGGGITTDSIARALILAPAFLAGIWGGARLFAQAPQNIYRKVALWVLLATGLLVLAL